MRFLSFIFMIGDLAIFLGKLIITLIKVLPKLIDMALSILDPINFLKDLVCGVIIGIELLISGISNMLFGKMKQQGKKLPGFNGIFPGGIFGKENSENNAEVKCLRPSALRLILMVLCPPFAIFMKYGLLRGWLWIIISIILTYNFYYFPGLLFSALHTMCI